MTVLDNDTHLLLALGIAIILVFGGLLWTSPRNVIIQCEAGTYTGEARAGELAIKSITGHVTVRSVTDNRGDDHDSLTFSNNNPCKVVPL